MDPHWFKLTLQMYTPTEGPHPKETEQESKKNIIHRCSYVSERFRVYVTAHFCPILKDIYIYIYIIYTHIHTYYNFLGEESML